MSLETLVGNLTTAIQQLTAAMTAQSGALAVVPQAPVQAAPSAPGMPPAPYAPPVAPVQQAVAPPPVPQPQGQPFPFADLPGLIKYATDAYHALEAKQPGRGSWLEGVPTQMGFAAANQIPPAHFGAFFAQVEHLKAQP